MTSDRKFNIGDLVRVRTWDDIAAEFPDRVGITVIDLPHHICVTREMCDTYGGMMFQVAETYSDDHFLVLETPDGSGRPGTWTWSVHMVELADDLKSDSPILPEQLSAILIGR